MGDVLLNVQFTCRKGFEKLYVHSGRGCRPTSAAQDLYVEGFSINLLTSLGRAGKNPYLRSWRDHDSPYSYQWYDSV